MPGLGGRQAGNPNEKAEKEGRKKEHGRINAVSLPGWSGSGRHEQADIVNMVS